MLHKQDMLDLWTCTWMLGLRLSASSASAARLMTLWQATPWPVLQLVSILALALSRALNVWPNAALVNYVRPPDLRIPQSQQLMIWFSGMRGAMAFAMVLRALEDLPGKYQTLELSRNFAGGTATAAMLAACQAMRHYIWHTKE